MARGKILPGEGILEGLNWIAEGLGKVASKTVEGINHVTDTAIAGVTSLADSLSGLGESWGPGGKAAAQPEVTQKLGGNADKERIMACRVEDTSPLGADMTKLVCPVTPMEVSVSKGPSVGGLG